MAPKAKRTAVAAAAGSPQTSAVKRSRSSPTWAEFVAGLETVVGREDVANACTEPFARYVRAEVIKQLSETDREHAEAMWSAGNSVTACGAKVGGDKIIRAMCSVVLSFMTTIKTSSTAAAMLWAAFPGGPTQLLAALGDEEGVVNEGRARLWQLMSGKDMGGSGCGQQRKRIQPIHLALLANKEQPFDGPGGRLDGKDYTQATKELTAIKGFGPKLAACVLGFTCDHAVLAVDTNVAKVTNALGWVTTKDEKQIHNELNGKGDVAGLIPRSIDGYSNLRRTLHSLLLNLGQAHAGEAKGLDEQGAPIDPKQAQQNAVGFVRKWKALGMPTA
jgi:endonuclease III